QIRVHLASIGYPVVGDKLYGSKKPKEVGLPNISRQLLHAYSLEFSPAPGKRLKLAASLPEDIKSTLQYLQKSAN
ncbi:MAG: RluA family pseudouridine synthase, partial [Candidatus Colwellbacteria bacterium]